MQLSNYGAKIIAVFALGGIVMVAGAVLLWRADGDSWGAATLGIVGGLWVLGAAIAIAIPWRMRRRAEHALELGRRGLRGEATIVEVIGARTATLDAVLDIRVPGQPPRRERRQVFVGPEAGHGLQPGMKLAVLADPEDPDDLMVGL